MEEVALQVTQDHLEYRVHQEIKETWGSEGPKVVKEKVTEDLQDHLDSQEYRVLVVSMELAIQATREFLGSLDYQEIQVNRAAQDFQEFVMCPCVIGPTTSGNTTAKDQMSDNI